MSDADQHPSKDAVAPEASATTLPRSDAADYWAHKIAEAAKKKVVSYFAVLGVLVALVVALFGMDRIRSLIDEQYEARVTTKEAEASARIDSLSKAFEARLRSLQERAETRSAEFHRVIGTTLEKVRTARADRGKLTVDISDKIGPIRDQGPEGTTVGFALAYALAAEVERATGQSPLYSARSIYVEARKWDEWPGQDYEGTSLLGGLTALKEIGAYLDSDWPYNQRSGPTPGTQPSQRISDFTLISRERSDLIISALKENRPVVATINVTDAFGTVGGDGRVSIGNDLQSQGGHLICIVGYNGDRDEFKFANMWGSDWGAAGFGFIRRSDLEKILQGAALLTLQE